MSSLFRSKYQASYCQNISGECCKSTFKCFVMYRIWNLSPRPRFLKIRFYNSYFHFQCLFYIGINTHMHTHLCTLLSRFSTFHSLRPALINPIYSLLFWKLFSCSWGNFMAALLWESNSSNAIAWMSNRKANACKFHFHFNEIWALSSIINVAFHHDHRLANSMRDASAK